MSQFECPVVSIGIEPHPNADALEIATVGGYKSVVKKDQFKSGELAIYLPEAAVLPEWLLKQLGFWDDANGCGKLNGADKNRIKAMKLRGILSQGILLKCQRLFPFAMRQRCAFGDTIAVEGDDFSEKLGVTKYEPAIPVQMAGKALGANVRITHNYDFDNIKKKPSLFTQGEEVVMTEKIHGTLIQICVVPRTLANEKFYGTRVIITSKGLGGKGIILDHNDMSNVYAQTCKKFGLLDLLLEAFAGREDLTEPTVLFGEVFGKCVQDLGYDCDLNFRAFDLCYGVRDEAKFVCYEKFISFCEKYNIPSVPLIYKGEYSAEALNFHTDGGETVSGKGIHMREGVVVKTAISSKDGFEETHPRYGRKIAKSVSEAYLLRKGNTTEFQ